MVCVSHMFVQFLLETTVSIILGVVLVFSYTFRIFACFCHVFGVWVFFVCVCVFVVVPCVFLFEIREGGTNTKTTKIANVKRNIQKNTNMQACTKFKKIHEYHNIQEESPRNGGAYCRTFPTSPHVPGISRNLQPPRISSKSSQCPDMSRIWYLSYFVVLYLLMCLYCGLHISVHFVVVVIVLVLLHMFVSLNMFGILRTLFIVCIFCIYTFIWLNCPTWECFCLATSLGRSRSHLARDSWACWQRRVVAQTLAGEHISHTFGDSGVAGRENLPVSPTHVSRVVFCVCEYVCVCVCVHACVYPPARRGGRTRGLAEVERSCVCV